MKIAVKEGFDEQVAPQTMQKRLQFADCELIEHSNALLVIPLALRKNVCREVIGVYCRSVGRKVLQLAL